jgi:hypothetical protein
MEPNSSRPDSGDPPPRPLRLVGSSPVAVGIVVLGALAALLVGIMVTWWLAIPIAVLAFGLASRFG